MISKLKKVYLELDKQAYQAGAFGGARQGVAEAEYSKQSVR